MGRGERPRDKRGGTEETCAGGKEEQGEEVLDEETESTVMR